MRIIKQKNKITKKNKKTSKNTDVKKHPFLNQFYSELNACYLKYIISNEFCIASISSSLG